MDKFEEFSTAVAREFAGFQGIDLELAEAAVYASPSVGYLNTCISMGYSAKQTAQGFSRFQKKYMGQLFSNAKKLNEDHTGDSDDIPF